MKKTTCYLYGMNDIILGVIDIPIYQKIFNRIFNDQQEELRNELSLKIQQKQKLNQKINDLKNHIDGKGLNFFKKIFLNIISRYQESNIYTLQKNLKILTEQYQDIELDIKKIQYHYENNQDFFVIMCDSNYEAISNFEPKKKNFVELYEKEMQDISKFNKQL